MDYSRIKTLLEGDHSTLVLVGGIVGGGKTRLILDAVQSIPHLYFPAPSLPDEGTRRSFFREVKRVTGLATPGGQSAPGWSELLQLLVSRGPHPGALGVGAERRVLIFDDVEILLDQSPRLLNALGILWNEARRDSPPLHLILIGRRADFLRKLNRVDGPFRDNPVPIIQTEAPKEPGTLVLVGARDYRESVSSLSRWDASERLGAFSIFGGLPENTRHVDANHSLKENVCRLILDVGSPLYESPLEQLREAFQAPARYAAIVQTLARGPLEWGGVLAGIHERGSGGRLAPYMNRLLDLGWVEASRSLDAHPRSRRRRYRIADPFLSFWFRFVHPHRSQLLQGSTSEFWDRVVEPQLEDHLSVHFPKLMSSFLTHHAADLLGSTAREAGGLWGEDYDIPIVATLMDGAVCYGLVHQGPGPADEPLLAHLNEMIRNTRYGFGRERRVRLILSATGFSEELRRRRRMGVPLHLIDAQELLA